ncbi:unnamed protein product [Schistosoma curassoni]|uniref:Uncharacterized protein n=1 Tax=Schistosoma curassoni TaxID=6186 RepID=A0A183JP73_9TREM|nr:unnamed protein product [Schistosoma curassoni]
MVTNLYYGRQKYIPIPFFENLEFKTFSQPHSRYSL